MQDLNFSQLTTHSWYSSEVILRSRQGQATPFLANHRGFEALVEQKLTPFTKAGHSSTLSADLTGFA